MSKEMPRETLSAKLSPEASEGWKSFCRNNGVSLAAMLEVAGLRLADETFPPQSEERKAMVDDARKIDIQRRARK